MFIREAQQDDIPELAGIIKDVFEEYGFLFHYQTELPDFVGFDSFYRNSSNSLFVVEHEDVLAGCGALKLESGEGVITRVYLRKKFRGKGLGKKLVCHLIDTAKSAGASSVVLWTDTRFTVAHRLYTSLGFSPGDRQRRLGDINDTTEIYFEMNLSSANRNNI
ncbi:MAG: GNAT family N-acetyltransferase [Balneolales bacterium]